MRKWRKIVFLISVILFVVPYFLLVYQQLRIGGVFILSTALLLTGILYFRIFGRVVSYLIGTVREQRRLIKELMLRIEKLEKGMVNQRISDPLLLPKINTKAAENTFHLLFRQQYPGFIPRLRGLVPDITPGEEHLCMMIKMNMPIWEMAQMMGIDVKSVHTSRARLKRKLKLDRDTNINDWINNMNIHAKMECKNETEKSI